MTYQLPQLLTNAAKHHPDKQAVAYANECLSYTELNDLASRLANALRQCGVQEGDRVGIYLDKSADSVLAVHAILKAGAVYVPLDPKAPPRRLMYIIQNCEIRTLISSSKKQSQIRKICDDNCDLANIVLLDKDSNSSDTWPVRTIWFFADSESYSDAPIRLTRIESDLAYILYTSGSTGVPKGVMISHRNALTFIDWAYSAFSVKCDDVLSNHAPLHFDLSIFDIFVAAKAAATVKPVPEGLAFFPFRLAEWIENEEITIWYSVPSILATLARKGGLDRLSFPTLRTILFAGEVFPIRQLRETLTYFPKVEFHNLYGPTETNVVTYYSLSELADDRINPIPIGRACDNTDVFLLDENGALITEPGVEAELCARGSCVAKGYWQDREKSDTVFFNSKLRSEYDDQVYRTGDIVVIDDDNNYVFVGRKDHMIKIRGYRVELGEIEAILYNHDLLDEAAVIAVADAESGNKLVAFVRKADASSLSETEVQAFCAEYLPRYMVPERVEFIEEMPRTATGKVDKKSLTA